MAALNTEGRRLLSFLVNRFDRVKIGQPTSYFTYKGVHDELGLAFGGGTWGRSLQRHGMSSLADWAHYQGYPAISGLIVSKKNFQPSSGYAKLLGFEELEDNIWHDEVKRAILFDWRPHLLG